MGVPVVALGKKTTRPGSAEREPELRYWWGERTGRSQMTGWFTGLYAGGGYYDVEWKTKGYQGEFVSAGITGGFAHSISKNWRMEYSLGLGYLGSKYREYTAKKMRRGRSVAPYSQEPGELPLGWSDPIEGIPGMDD